ncbi:hypothetical protein GE061_015759 [Apolygus lucorum]|uniref:Uncharacterized protein n=1 Tax=Apolygus lucorum TaxID=248454 RepID=A0A8S9XN25_APOLU|nr:hypothetical protein GE061_015759 [Apolygus lucorum]
MFSTWGLGLMAISLIVNYSHLITAFLYGGDSIYLSFEEAGANYGIFFLFTALGCVTYFSAMVGSYQERTFPMKLAIVFLCAQGALWVILTAFSYADQFVGKISEVLFGDGC